MQRLFAFVRSRPKTSFAVLVAVLVLAAGFWNAYLWKEGKEPYEMGSIAPPPMMTGGYGIKESTGGGTEDLNEAQSGVGMMRGAPAGIPPLPRPTAGATAAEVDQKIIKNGNLSLTVGKVADAADRITQLAQSGGGFVQSSMVADRGDGTYRGEVSVRVPVAKFEEMMGEIKKLASFVRSETATGQDVTEQYTDLQAQLRNAQAQEQTYLEVLKQARSVEDILKVQAQLGAIRGQIESLQGRITYLGNQTSYSTISVTLEEEPNVRAPTRGFRPFAIVQEAAQELVATVQNIIAGLIWIVILWGGILIPLILVLWIIAKLWKRRAKRNPQA